MPGQKSRYTGKVRDVYFFEDKIASVATDRISAFDHILPAAIPYKGQVLNQLAAYFLNACKDIVPVWLEKVIDPNVSVGKRCQPIKIEMVIRAYLVGHAWRVYRSGNRKLCGSTMPDGLRESEPFPSPLITPAVKADEGHDEDISKSAILEKKLVDPDLYEQMESYTYQLFKRGVEMAEKRGLILVDTKYEFGLSPEGELTLIDEVHTPDSSRYFYAGDYEKNLSKGLPQDHLSKEFVREWLMENGFQGLEGQILPEMTHAVVEAISQRYIGLYEKLTGTNFELPTTEDADIHQRVYQNMLNWARENRV